MSQTRRYRCTRRKNRCTPTGFAPHSKSGSIRIPAACQNLTSKSPWLLRLGTMFAAVISLSSAKINCGRPLLDRRVHMSGATTRRCLIQRLAPVVIALIIAAYAQAAAPRLYRQPAYESTVRGEPDDLLLIAGYGLSKDDRVVYRAVNASQMVHPRMPPARSAARSGLPDDVNNSNVPYSLPVRLPESLVATQTYELWVVTAQQEWSEPVRFNDARPLWLSPAVIYAREPD